MDRRKFMLAAMSPAGTENFSPVQVQKIFFLLDRNIADRTGGVKFDFVPYDYGPFDIDVYNELENLQEDELVEVTRKPAFGHRTFQLTDQGLKEGQIALSELSDNSQDYIGRVVDWVRSLTFPQLVSAIYREYPDMKENSVFW